MCLRIAIERPDRVLAKGEHLGFQWIVTHNSQGYRCGYVRVPAGHPWHGKHYHDDGFYVDVHGGCTFAEADVNCDKGGEDNAWWFGFDCAHGFDAPDLSLPVSPEWQAVADLRAKFSSFELGEARSQAYVENECRSLCEQAAAVTLEKAS